LIDGAEQNMEFMRSNYGYYYYENDDIQAVKIPYKGSKNSFCVLLPKYRISSLEEVLNKAYFDNIFTNMPPRNMMVSISLPKFKLEKKYDLIKSLQNMGLNLPFTNLGSFSGISKTENIAISKLFHKSFFEINEKGTEASAATEASIIVGGTKPIDYIIFNADHPFIFMIMADDTNEILFMGKYVGND
jgi:serpin B